MQCVSSCIVLSCSLGWNTYLSGKFLVLGCITPRLWVNRNYAFPSDFFFFFRKEICYFKCWPWWPLWVPSNFEYSVILWSCSCDGKPKQKKPLDSVHFINYCIRQNNQWEICFNKEHPYTLFHQGVLEHQAVALLTAQHHSNIFCYNRACNLSFKKL